MKPFFRFGQPIGTGMVIVGFLETIYSLYWLMLDFVSLEHTSTISFLPGLLPSEFDSLGHLLWHFLIALHFLLSCVFWISIIFDGRKCYLYTWLVLSFFQNIAFTTITALVLRETPNDDTSNFLPVLGSLSFYALWRCYTLSVACQGLRRLKNKYDLRSDSVSDIDICLEPVGSGACQVIEFFRELPGVGAITLLTIETLWNAVNLFTRPIVELFYGLDVFQMPIFPLQDILDILCVEETVIRVVRICLNLICICLLAKEKVAGVRIWVVFYLLLAIASNVFAGLMITHWWTVVPPLDVIYFHVFILIADNVFRIFVLYFTIKYAMIHLRTIVKL